MKLVEVMASVDRVAKNGNNQSQGYKYAQAADVYGAVRSELARRFVLLIPRLEKLEFQDVPTKSGGTLRLCSWFGAFDFMDAESGEVQTVKAFGQGSDSGDKAGYKAITGATKSVLVQMFLIPTGDDPENERTQKPEPPPPAGMAAVKSKLPQQQATSVHDSSFVMPFANKENLPLSQLTPKSLMWFRATLTANIADASKAQFADSNRNLLSKINAEITARGIA